MTRLGDFLLNGKMQKNLTSTNLNKNSSYLTPSKALKLLLLTYGTLGATFNKVPIVFIPDWTDFMLTMTSSPSPLTTWGVWLLSCQLPFLTISLSLLSLTLETLSPSAAPVARNLFSTPPSSKTKMF